MNEKKKFSDRPIFSPRELEESKEKARQEERRLCKISIGIQMAQGFMSNPIFDNICKRIDWAFESLENKEGRKHILEVSKNG